MKRENLVKWEKKMLRGDKFVDPVYFVREEPKTRVVSHP